MTIEPLGDSAYIVRDLPGPPYMFVDPILKLNRPEILDVNASYQTLGIYTRPGALQIETLEELFTYLKPNFEWEGASHKIPVLYDGADLETVARQLGLTREDVVHLHTSLPY